MVSSSGYSGSEHLSAAERNEEFTLAAGTQLLVCGRLGIATGRVSDCRSQRFVVEERDVRRNYTKANPRPRRGATAMQTLGTMLANDPSPGMLVACHSIRAAR